MTDNLASRFHNEINLIPDPGFEDWNLLTQDALYFCRNHIAGIGCSESNSPSYFQSRNLQCPYLYCEWEAEREKSPASFLAN